MTARKVVEVGPELYLPVAVYKDGAAVRVVMKAELVPGIAPHLARVASFAVHEVIKHHPRGKRWRVSNVETGLRVSVDYLFRTKYEAIEMTRHRLAGVTADRIEIAMQKYATECNNACHDADSGLK